MKILKMILFIIACELVGIAGSIFTIDSINSWYVTLNKPIFNPPNWIFGPVWTVLYALMGISAYLIWQKSTKKKEVSEARKYFVVQLILNGIWTPIFFGFKELFIALIVIIAMLIFIVVTILKFYKLDKKAGLLLIPYLLWVSFATVLNFSLWYLNR